MSDQKISYGSSGQIITITLVALIGARESDVIDNSNRKALDYLVGGLITFGAPVPARDNRRVELYVYGTADGGITYTGGATGNDAAFTFPLVIAWRRTVLKPLGNVLWHPGGSVAQRFGPFSVAAAFNGIVPEQWGVIALNRSGSALAGFASDFSITYQAIYAKIL